MLMMTSVTQVPVKNCDGGHYCSPPKECCKQGCCYLLAPSVSYRPPTLPTTSMLNPLFLGHWYFWAAVTATVAGILCACSLWRKHSHRSLCCRGSGRDDRASEPDSNGSCYAPPHYSRCNSFHQAPPPYSEVTSKPDLYPLVISYNGYNGYNTDSSQKVGRGSTGYLMVQYFRNYIVRPVGSLSATSTMESLGSSFICNATNEANSIIPPPYSCTGSLEEVNVNTSNPSRSSPEFPRSISSATCNDFHLVQHSPVGNSHPNIPQVSTNNSINIKHNSSNQNLVKEVSITSNPGYIPNPVQTLPAVPSARAEEPAPVPRRKLENSSVDTESQDDDHNFADLLNLSVCIPSTITHLPLGTMTSSSQGQDLHYSVVNSITSSDVSSLANLGTPDSPPRATSPTAEIRELLDKIQQLPQHKSPVPEASQPEPKRSCFRSKSKTLYMPLDSVGRVSPNGRVFKSKKGWLSRSAPTTPCGSFAPNFPKSSSQKGSRGRISDGSPLLNEHEESDEEQKNQCS